MAGNIALIDGSILEGGGQILRNAAALSCLLGTPITVNNIRAGRSKPGLRPQHLSGLQLIRDVCGGKLDGGHVGSTEITFHPGNIKGGSYLADTKTAGSICLLIQAALPCLFYASSPADMHLKGGTNAEMAPQIDYLTWVFQPLAERFGVRFDCDIRRRGYFPKGGGEVTISCAPLRHIEAVDLTEPGHITRVTGRAFVAGVLPKKISHTMAQVAHDTIKKQYRDVPIDIEAIKEPDHAAFGNGVGIILMAETSNGCRLAGTALGKRGVPAEEVGKAAADMLLRNLSPGGCVDEYLQDQLIILMALARGKSRVKCGPITQHTETAIHIAETLTKATFKVEQLTEDLNIIECEGMGLANQQI